MHAAEDNHVGVRPCGLLGEPEGVADKIRDVLNLIVISDTPPLLYGISLIGIIGFLAAAVMGIWLLVAIFRKGL